MIRQALQSARARYTGSVPAQAALWYTAGSAFQKGLDLLLAPVFLYLLTPDQYGQVALFLTWMTVFAIVLPLRVDASVGRARFDYAPPAFRRFLSAGLGLGLLTGLGWLVLLALLPDTLRRAVFQLPRGAVLLAGGAALILFAVEMTLQDWRYAYRYRLLTLVTVALGLLRTGLSIAFILVLPGWLPGFDPALARMLGVLVAGLPFALALGGRVLAGGRTLYHRADWRYALAYSVPLLPHLIAGLLLSQIDRVLISEFVGLAETGIYSFAYLIGSVVFMLWQNLNGAWIPWFYARMNDGDTALIRQRARQYVAGFGLLTAALIVLLPLPLRVVIPESYRAGLPLIPVVMSGCFFMLPYSLYVNTEFYAKQTGLLSVGTLLAFAANLGLNLLLIPRFGVPAAAWTTVIGYALLFVIHAQIVQVRLGRRDLFDFWPMLLGGVLLVVLAAGMSALLAGW